VAEAETASRQTGLGNNPDVRALALMAIMMFFQAPPVVTPESLVDDVRTLTRAKDNDERFDVLSALLRARHLEFTVEPFTLEKPIGADPRTRGRNVVVSVGTGASEIVLGAHYDAIRLPDGSQGAGAVDNASSAVMLVHLAEALHAAPPSARVRLVWFDMEEYGPVGSARYAEAHASDRIAAMLNFDINGYGDTLVFAAPQGGEDERLRRAFTQTCVDEAIDCVRFARLPRGDDRSFGLAKVPTLSIGMVSAVEAHQLWLLLQAGAASGLAEGTRWPGSMAPAWLASFAWSSHSCGD
jgi:hypothetical protein